MPRPGASICVPARHPVHPPFTLLPFKTASYPPCLTPSSPFPQSLPCYPIGSCKSTLPHSLSPIHPVSQASMPALCLFKHGAAPGAKPHCTARPMGSSSLPNSFSIRHPTLTAFASTLHSPPLSGTATEAGGCVTPSPHPSTARHHRHPHSSGRDWPPVPFLCCSYIYGLVFSPIHAARDI